MTIEQLHKERKLCDTDGKEIFPEVAVAVRVGCNGRVRRWF